MNDLKVNCRKMKIRLDGKFECRESLKDFAKVKV